MRTRVQSIPGRVLVAGIAIAILSPPIPEASAARPSLNALNTRVNQLEAENNGQQEQINALLWPVRFQLVGFTSTTFNGAEGVLGFTLACQTEFPGSRMCSSVEVMETTVVPTSLTGEAWVRPVLVPAGGTQNASDASGLATLPSVLSCNGWNAGTTYSGLGINAAGQFDIFVCATPRAVACCAPVP